MNKVAILLGSKNDLPKIQGCFEILEYFGISHEVKILSAHRTPKRTSKFSRQACNKGLEVIIAGAGWSAHLAGVMASETTLPVIGVPIASSPLNGLDALLSTVQMPGGIPVATMSIGKAGARNAAIFAAQILSLKYPEIREKILAYRKEMENKVKTNAKKLKQKLSADT